MSELIEFQPQSWLQPKLTSRDASCVWLSDSIQSWLPNKKADVVFVGVPFDHAVNYRPGARFAPNAIRHALSSQSMYVTDRRVDLSNLVIADAGDIDTVHSLDETYSRINQVINSIGNQGVTVILGGDHSITRPSINGVLPKLCSGGRLGLLVFDAHFDSRRPTVGKEHSGHWLRQVQDDLPGILHPENIAIVGLSAGGYSPDYQIDADRRGILSFTSSEVRQQGIEAVTENCLKHICNGTEGIYITVDVDVMHQSFAPGTSVPNPNGLWSEMVIDSIFEVCKKANVLALDITELNPLLDQAGITSGIAAQIIMHALAGLAIHHKGV